MDENFIPKKIKVWFTDIPYSSFGREDNWIINTLKERYEVELTQDNPEFLFGGIFGYDNLRYKNCVKVFFTGETAIPDFSVWDYAMSFNYIDFGDRHIRAIVGDPRAETITTIKKSIQDRSKVTKDLLNRKFCNFVYSQDSVGEGALLRKEFCQKLMERYKKVDCPGLVLNNMPEGSIGKRWKNDTYSSGDVTDDWEKSKLLFLENYKFTIAFENISQEGYTTEKLLHPFKSFSIPIYWGNPLVSKDFNTKSFINCHDYNDFDEVIERIIELDNDDKKYMEMLMESPMNDSFDFRAEERAKNFLFHIIEKGNRPFDRDPLCASTVNQLYKDVDIAWHIIADLKAQLPLESTDSLPVSEKAMIENMETSLTWRIVNRIRNFFDTKIGRIVKKVVKPVLLGLISFFHWTKKLIKHRNN